MDNITALSNPEVIPKIAALLAALAKDPSLYRMVTAITPSLEELTEIHETHQTVYNASGSGDPEILRQLQAARKRMDYKYGIFFSLLKHAAVENPDLPAKLGVSQSKPKKVAAQMTSPLNPRARHMETSGKMLLKVDPVKGAKSYDISICQGDPSIEANWKHCGVGTKASRLLVEGLVPGTTYWFRVRAIGSKGPGPWSQFVCIMAL